MNYIQEKNIEAFIGKTRKERKTIKNKLIRENPAVRKQAKFNFVIVLVSMWLTYLAWRNYIEPQFFLLGFAVYPIVGAIASNIFMGLKGNHIINSELSKSNEH